MKRLSILFALVLGLGCSGANASSTVGADASGVDAASEGGAQQVGAAGSTAACLAAGGTCQEEAPCFGTWAGTTCSGASVGWACCIPPSTPTPCQNGGGTCSYAGGALSPTSCPSGTAVSALSCDTPGGENGVFRWWCCVVDADAGDGGEAGAARDSGGDGA